MIELRLPRGVWYYDPEKPLGPPGGFGAVFAGADSENAVVAVKRLHLEATEAAHREMRIADHLADRQFQHILPIFDAGLDANSNAYFVVMPRAERSLQDEIDRRGRLANREAAPVLLQIANGVAEIPELTHRDLKPANVLFHDAVWKIADFGIARFVEDATSPRTLKGCLSPEYAAPEQWRLERATTATDVYALGCIAHTLLTGNPPFGGNTEELSQKHLTQQPPGLPDCPPELRSLVSMMLRKTPKSRPTVPRIVAVLTEVSSDTPDTEARPGLSALASADAAIAQAESEEDARRAKEMSHLAERNALAVEAHRILETLRARLFALVQKQALTATVDEHNRAISVGQATLHIEPFSETIPADSFPNSKWDVIAGAIVAVLQKHPECARSASLLYADAGRASSYRWYELAFETHPLMLQRRRKFEPFALQAHELRDADMAIGAGMHTIQLASPPCTVHDEDEAAFTDRWANVLAQAAQGRLK